MSRIGPAAAWWRAWPVALAIAIAVPGTAAAAERAHGPSLKLAAVAKPPRIAVAGERVKLRATIINRSRHRAKGTLRFYLSRDRRPSADDLPLGGKRRVKTSRRRSRESGRFAVPETATLGARMRVVGCLAAKKSRSPKSCDAAAGRVYVSGGSSFELIDADRDLGRLSVAKAALYKVRAVFGDAIPRRYRGDGSRNSGTVALMEARAAMGSASGRVRAGLEPYLIPPIYRGGLWDVKRSDSLRSSRGDRAQRRVTSCDFRLSETDSVAVDGVDARIWWRKSDPEHEAQAERLGAALAGKIWPKLSGLMGRTQPLHDKSFSCSGSDDRLDIYLNPMAKADEGVTTSLGPACSPGPSYVIVDPRAPRGVLAHEIMHVLQFTYQRREPCKQYEYLDDAVASWAENYVYPRDNTEHIYPQLIEVPNALFNAGSGYPGWAFAYAVTRSTKNDGVIPAIYAAAKDKPPLEALAAALPGGLDKQWPAFARYAWNRELRPDALPESFFSKSWDSWTPKPKGVDPEPQKLDGADTSIVPLPIQLTAIGKQYRQLTFPDQDAREITFKDPNAAGADPKLQTHAFVKLADGSWEHEDWTGRSERTFCRDDADEDVRKVVVINTTTTLPGSDPTQTIVDTDAPKLKLRDHCDAFPEAWTGTASGTVTESGPPGNLYRESWTAKLTLVRTFQDNGVANYEQTSAQVNWKLSQTTSDSSGTCTYKGSKSYNVGPLPGFGLGIYEWDDPSLEDEYDLGLGIGGEFATVDGDCIEYGKPHHYHDDHFVTLNLFDEASASGQPWKPRARTITGSATYPSKSEPDMTVHWQWDLTAD